MKSDIQENRLEKIINELEKRYPFFKKMDIYSTVKDAYKKVHGFFASMSEKEFEEVKNVADDDLRHSLIL